MGPKERHGPLRRIPAKEAVKDIRTGMSDSDLMAKYKLTTKGLQRLFQKLSEAGLLNQAERGTCAVDPDVASPPSWKCPACGTPQTHEVDECPRCGIVVAKFKVPARIPVAIKRRFGSHPNETPSPLPLTDGERSPLPAPLGPGDGRVTVSTTQQSDLTASRYGGELPALQVDERVEEHVGPVRAFSKRFSIDMSPILGGIGCLLLFAGVFLPVVKLPFIGGVTLMQIGKVTGGVAGFAYFILAITAISIVLILFKYYRWLWLTSLGSAAVLLYTFLQFRRGLFQAKTWIGSIFAGKEAPQFFENPQLRVIKDQMQQMMTLGTDWGWAILFAGSALLAAAACIATMRAPSLKQPPGT